jgi:DNA-binding SARP family transcriptional activator/TolB-like protein
MIEVGLLGVHTLRDEAGRELPTLLAQPKRFALLAYLAVGSRHGYLRRDSLAAMFWPELDQFAARRALRNTLYHLRDALGADVIVARGDDAVRIDPARVTCDVTRLDEAAAAGRLEAVSAAYTGELLAGLHFANAGEAFEEWLSGERRRIRDQVLSAVGALVEREERAGHIAAAAHWAQRACALAPGDEQSLRRAMALLDRSGDTGGALRLHETAVRRLATDFGATPSRDTEALASGIRDGRAKGRGPEPGRSPPPAAPTPHATAERRRVFPRALGWAAGITALAGAALVVRAVNAGHAGHHPPPPRVLVTVFDNRTGDTTLQALGRMAQDWIAQGILRTRLVEVVDPRAALEQDRSTPDPVALAHRTGAALVVSGSYYRTGDSLLLEAAITDARTGRLARVVGPIRSSARTPVAGLDELKSRVMTALATAVDAHAAPDLQASVEVPPYDAYEAYLEGWDAFWHGDGRRADTLFLRAAARDSLFAAAAIAAAAAASNYNECALVDSLDDALRARAQPLERIDRLSLQIAVARCHGRNEEMLRFALERAELAPRTSSLQLSAAAAALWADRPARALEVLRRLDPETDLGWSTDSTHLDYWSDLTEALHLLGRHEEELAAADRVPRAAPLTRAWLRGRALAALSRPTAALVLIDSTLTLPVETANRIGLAPFTDGRPEYSATPAWVACWIGHELAVHGDTVAARQAGTRAWTWYRARPPAERATFEERLVATWSLELMGDYGDAEVLGRALLAADPDNVDVRGELAGVAAERGERALADSLDRWLAAQPVARVGWTAAVYRARVAALLGRPDEAVARTAEALDLGAWPLWIHQETALAPLRTRHDYLALTAPRD